MTVTRKQIMVSVTVALLLMFVLGTALLRWHDTTIMRRRETSGSSPAPLPGIQLPKASRDAREVGVHISRLQVIAVPKRDTSISYRELYQRASSGDSVASYQLFRLLQTCGAFVAQPGKVQRDLPQFDAAWCEQVPSDEMSYLKWLREGVKGGYIPAIMAAYRENVPSICEAASQDGTQGDPTRIQDEGARPVPACRLESDAMDAAIKQGSLNAIVARGVASIWTDSSHVTAYAYISAALDGISIAAAKGVAVDSGASMDGKTYDEFLRTEAAKYNQWLAMWSARMTDEQRQQAQAQARAILGDMRNCCQLFSRSNIQP